MGVEIVTIKPDVREAIHTALEKKTKIGMYSDAANRYFLVAMQSASDSGMLSTIFYEGHSVKKTVFADDITAEDITRKAKFRVDLSQTPPLIIKVKSKACVVQ